jgi:carbonic anhydrase/acetyltransferase-like protein (isoleucine patch superfamily)
MIIEHLGKVPQIHPSAYIAPNATICGDVTIGEGARVLFGAQIIAEGGKIDIGKNCIILENAVVRSKTQHSTCIGPHTLIGPNAHVVGCTIEESVFIATGAAIFHGAFLGARSEVRINGIVHLLTHLPADSLVPIGWVAVGNPAQILPPDQHEKIWAIQQPLNFPKTVYGVKRVPQGVSNMPEITERLSNIYGSHKDDTVLEKFLTS